ncbi:hypothetical protein [Emticicia sp. TH156]|uniref:hypothetical protein n=1 Tax=Emticicia sp. TH156 TaxID=2067454 RepID=UPI001303FBFC|nr:hypothetical protein [Emticicia sp. TH156]
MKKEPTKKHNNQAKPKEKKQWIVPKMRILAVNSGYFFKSTVEDYAYFVNS